MGQNPVEWLTPHPKTSCLNRCEYDWKRCFWTVSIEILTNTVTDILSRPQEIMNYELWFFFYLELMLPHWTVVVQTSINYWHHHLTPSTHIMVSHTLMHFLSVFLILSRVVLLLLLSPCISQTSPPSTQKAPKAVVFSRLLEKGDKSAGFRALNYPLDVIKL